MSTDASQKKYSATGSGQKYTGTGSQREYNAGLVKTSDIGTPYPFSEEVVIEYLLKESGDFLLLETGDRIILD
jgi:hypothetical protein